MNEEKKLAQGFYFKKAENAPDFVIGKLSIKTDEALSFIKENTNEKGWLNLDIKQSKAGGFYLNLDNWEPKKDFNSKPVSINTKSDLPF